MAHVENDKIYMAHWGKLGGLEEILHGSDKKIFILCYLIIRESSVFGDIHICVFYVYIMFLMCIINMKLLNKIFSIFLIRNYSLVL